MSFYPEFRQQPSKPHQCIHVDEDGNRCGSHAMQELRDRLISGPSIYILFPEGTRSRDGSLGRFKPGLGMIVAGAPVPVVPCHLEGAFAASPPGARVPRPLPLRLRIGAPLAFGDLPNDRSGWQ